MAEEEIEDSIQIKLYKGPVDSLSLYEITDYELGVLEKGIANSRPLEISVTVLLISFMLTVFLSTLNFGLLFMALFVITAIGIGISVLALVFWKRNCSRSKRLCAKIRKRISVESMRKPDGRTQVPHVPVSVSS